MASVVSLTTPLNMQNGGIDSINFTVEDDGAKSYSIPSDSPNFAPAVEAVEAFKKGELANEALSEKLIECTNLVSKVAKKFTRINGILDGRMTLAENTILVDHEKIDPVLESYILRLLKEDGSPKDLGNWRSFARFVEKLYSNTSDHVREQLFGWLQYQNTHGDGFTIADDGDLIGYKGCAGTIEAPTSINHGTAIVNGVTHKGAIPNPLGAIVEMPKTKVQADPSVGCTTGLHIGTYAYASGFSRGVLLKVKFSPAFTVSVPTECQAQKVRVFRYEVLEVIEGPDNTPVYSYSSRYASDSNYCEYCGLEELADSETYCEECEDILTNDDTLEVQDNTDRKVIFQKAEKAGSIVSFIYNGKDRAGKVTSSWGAFSSSSIDRVNVEDSAGNVRTFKIDRVRNLKDTTAETPSPAADSLYATVKDAVAGKKNVSFLYNGSERKGVLTSEWTPWHTGDKRVNLQNDDGSTQTFKLSKIKNLTLKEEKVSSLPADALPARIMKAVSESGGSIKFYYLGAYRVVEVKTVFKSSNEWYMKGKETSTDVVKTFKVDSMSDITPVK